VKLTVLFPHRIKSGPLSELADQYVKFAGRFVDLKLQVLPFTRAGKTRPDFVERVRKSAAILLSERGREVDTRWFAKQLADASMAGTELVFVVSGAEGPPAEVEAACPRKVRLSPLTMPHEMALVVLLEQLWRATAITHNHPYHK